MAPVFLLGLEEGIYIHNEVTESFPRDFSRR